MNILGLLIFASLAIATIFLLGFIWAVRSGQFEDTSTPAMRLLMDDAERQNEHSIPPAMVNQYPLSCKGIHLPDCSAKIEPVPANSRVVANSSISDNQTA